MTEIQKSQTVRLIDVFLIGPMMIAAGRSRRMPEWMRLAMMGTGFLTIIYNGNNYIKNATRKI